jgi:hypothetical protein
MIAYKPNEVVFKNINAAIVVKIVTRILLILTLDCKLLLLGPLYLD